MPPSYRRKYLSRFNVLQFDIFLEMLLFTDDDALFTLTTIESPCEYGVLSHAWLAAKLTFSRFFL